MQAKPKHIRDNWLLLKACLFGICLGFLCLNQGDEDLQVVKVAVKF